MWGAGVKTGRRLSREMLRAEQESPNTVKSGRGANPAGGAGRWGGLGSGRIPGYRVTVDGDHRIRPGGRGSVLG
ncbi:hypothetical protein GCM10009828_024730 [Actinoplanes couchii]